MKIIVTDYSVYESIDNKVRSFGQDDFIPKSEIDGNIIFEGSIDEIPFRAGRYSRILGLKGENYIIFPEKRKGEI